MKPWMVAVILVAAALLEVCGDAAVRHGLRGARWGFAAGAVVLFAYGVVVNLPKWDFGRLMGVYIAAFFVVSQIVAWAAFGERPSGTTWLGGALIVAGGAVLTLGHR